MRYDPARTKKISIVLPVYNGAKYLAESIESILNQSYANWELIIVNDCSSDNTLTIASEYATRDARIKVFSNTENLKLPKTLNVGFKHATGAYYTWTSDDNRYKPNALQVMVENIEKAPDIVMVYANYTVIDSKGNETEQVKKPEPKYLFIGNVIGACFLYTADAAKTIGEYDTNLFLAEDYDFWIRLSKVGNILHIENNLYCYRKHKNALTETKKQYIAEQTYKVLEKHFLFAYTKSKENGLCYDFLDHMLSKASAHHAQTLKKILLVNKKYKYYLKWRNTKLFAWYVFLWRTIRRPRGLV